MGKINIVLYQGISLAHDFKRNHMHSSPSERVRNGDGLDTFLELYCHRNTGSTVIVGSNGCRSLVGALNGYIHIEGGVDFDLIYRMDSIDYLYLFVGVIAIIFRVGEINSINADSLCGNRLYNV